MPPAQHALTAPRGRPSLKGPAHSALSVAERAVRHVESVAARLQASGPATQVSLGVVLVGFDLARTVDVAEAISSRITASVDICAERVLIANSDEVYEHFKSAADFRIVRGSNAEAEFSGYREGVRALAPHPTDALLLANDRALSYGDDVLTAIDTAVIRLCRVHQIAIGRIDRLSGLRLLGSPIFDYLRSNFILGNRERLETSLPVLDEKTLERLLPRNWAGASWAQGSELDAEYADFVTRWLTGDGDGPKWYKASPLSAKGWASFRSKTRSIMYEHLLSASLIGQGTALIPLAEARVLARMSSQVATRRLRALTNARFRRGLRLIQRLINVAMVIAHTRPKGS